MRGEAHSRWGRPRTPHTPHPTSRARQRRAEPRWAERSCRASLAGQASGPLFPPKDRETAKAVLGLGVFGFS